MDINVNTKNLTAFSKWLAGAIVAGAGLWADPTSHAAIVRIISAYPHGSEVVGIIGAFFLCWGTLHNPVKAQGAVKP